MSLGWVIIGAFALGGGMEVIADTPDALCPTNGDVQEALDDRLGQIDGGQYRLHHGIIREASSGRRLLRLRLLGSEDAPLLERTIPVQDADCGNLATVIALIIDTYFGSYEPTPTGQRPPAEHASALKRANGEPVPGPAEDTPLPVEEAAPRPLEGKPAGQTNAKTSSTAPKARAPKERTPTPQRQAPKASVPKEPPPSAATLFLGAGVDTNLAASVIIGGRYKLGGFWMAQLHGLVQPVPVTVEDAGYSLRLSRQMLGLGVGGVWTPLPALRLHFAPTVGLHLEASELDGAQVQTDGIHWRATGALGATAGFAWHPSHRVTLGVDGFVHATLIGQSYSVSSASGGYTELLAPPFVAGNVLATVGLAF